MAGNALAGVEPSEDRHCGIRAEQVRRAAALARAFCSAPSRLGGSPAAAPKVEEVALHQNQEVGAEAAPLGKSPEQLEIVGGQLHAEGTYELISFALRQTVLLPDAADHMIEQAEIVGKDAFGVDRGAPRNRRHIAPLTEGVGSHPLLTSSGSKSNSRARQLCLGTR